METKGEYKPITPGEYGRVAAATDLRTICPGPLPYLAIGLCNEAGEVAGKVKKLFRDHNGITDSDRRREIADECGDVLWYLVRVAEQFGYSLQDLMDMNAAKLEKRAAENLLRGDGDNRHV